MRRRAVRIKIYVKKQQNVFHSVNKTKERAVKALYALSCLIASYFRTLLQKANLFKGV
jgi:hypothetical protein